MKLGRDRENRRVRHERDQRAGVLLVLRSPMTFELLRRLAALEGHVIDLPIARDLDLEPLRQRVDALRADAVHAAGILVSALAEFAARVQLREHQLHRGNLELRMDVHRDAAAVVADRTRAIDVDGHIDARAMAREMFVDRVVQHFENAMVQARARRVARCTCPGAAARRQALRVCRSWKRRTFRLLGKSSNLGASKSRQICKYL